MDVAAPSFTPATAWQLMLRRLASSWDSVRVVMVGVMQAALGTSSVVSDDGSRVAIARTVAMVATLLDFIAEISAAVEQLHNYVARVARIVQRLEDPAYGVDERDNADVLVLSVVIFLEVKLQYVLLDLRSRCCAQ